MMDLLKKIFKKTGIDIKKSFNLKNKKKAQIYDEENYYYDDNDNFSYNGNQQQQQIEEDYYGDDSQNGFSPDGQKSLYEDDYSNDFDQNIQAVEQMKTTAPKEYLAMLFVIVVDNAFNRDPEKLQSALMSGGIPNLSYELITDLMNGAEKNLSDKGVVDYFLSSRKRFNQLPSASMIEAFMSNVFQEDAELQRSSYVRPGQKVMDIIPSLALNQGGKQTKDYRTAFNVLSTESMDELKATMEQKIKSLDPDVVSWVQKGAVAASMSEISKGPSFVQQGDGKSYELSGDKVSNVYDGVDFSQMDEASKYAGKIGYEFLLDTMKQVDRIGDDIFSKMYMDISDKYRNTLNSLRPEERNTASGRKKIKKLERTSWDFFQAEKLNLYMRYSASQAEDLLNSSDVKAAKTKDGEHIIFQNDFGKVIIPISLVKEIAGGGEDEDRDREELKDPSLMVKEFKKKMEEDKDGKISKFYDINWESMVNNRVAANVYKDIAQSKGMLKDQILTYPDVTTDKWVKYFIGLRDKILNDKSKKSEEEFQKDPISNWEDAVNSMYKIANIKKEDTSFMVQKKLYDYIYMTKTQIEHSPSSKSRGFNEYYKKDEEDQEDNIYTMWDKIDSMSEIVKEFEPASKDIRDKRREIKNLKNKKKMQGLTNEEQILMENLENKVKDLENRFYSKVSKDHAFYHSEKQNMKDASLPVLAELAANIEGYAGRRSVEEEIRDSYGKIIQKPASKEAINSFLSLFTRENDLANFINKGRIKNKYDYKERTLTELYYAIKREEMPPHVKEKIDINKKMNINNRSIINSFFKEYSIYEKTLSESDKLRKRVKEIKSDIDRVYDKMDNSIMNSLDRYKKTKRDRFIQKGMNEIFNRYPPEQQDKAADVAAQYLNKLYIWSESKDRKRLPEELYKLFYRPTAKTDPFNILHNRERELPSDASKILKDKNYPYNMAMYEDKILQSDYLKKSLLEKLHQIGIDKEVNLSNLRLAYRAYLDTMEKISYLNNLKLVMTKFSSKRGFSENINKKIDDIYFNFEEILFSIFDK